MTDAKIAQQGQRCRVSFVSRRISSGRQKIQPFHNEELVHTTENTKEANPKRPPSISTSLNSLDAEQTTQAMVLRSSDGINTSNANRASTAVMLEMSSRMSIGMKNQKGKQLSVNSLRSWFNRLTPKNKCIVKLLIVTVILVVASAAAILPPIFIFVIRQSKIESSASNITASICSATTCIGKETPFRTSMVTVLYPFDGNVNDVTGYAVGTLYIPIALAYTTSTYIGSLGLVLTSVSLYYVEIPYVNLAQKSFTIQAWVMYTPVVGQNSYGIFGQCDSNMNCLSISVRNARFTFSLDSMNNNNYTLTGTSVLPTSEWVHLTVVYDTVLFQQQIYFNGKIDAISYGIISAYKGTSSGSITTIGKTLSLAYGYTFFNGRIDHFTISAGSTRTACQILNDATLIAYFPFNSVASYNDYSVSLYNGVGTSTTTISTGRLGQAIYFASSASYFQTRAFPPTRASNLAFSISLWVNPTVVSSGGSLVHMSPLQTGNGTRCYELLTFLPTGDLIFQWMQSVANINGTQGPNLPVNTWTHVAYVYGSANGVRLYINGQLTTTSQNIAALTWQAETDPLYITLGNISPLGSSAVVNCKNGTISYSPGSYSGAIDEFRLYNRELDNQEICVLADM